MASPLEPVVRALDNLAAVLDRVGEEMHGLAGRASSLRDECAAGGALMEIMAAEPRPLVVTRMTQLLDELADASAAVRRAEAQRLRAEGLSHERIAAVFGVTRQRAAALLEPAPAPHARMAKRPRPAP